MWSVSNAGGQRSGSLSVFFLLTFHALPLTFHGKTERDKEMTTESVLSIGQEAIQTILLVAGPMLGLSLLVGLCVSAFQAIMPQDLLHRSLLFGANTFLFRGDPL